MPQTPFLTQLRLAFRTPEGRLTLGLCALIVLLMGTYSAVLIVEQQNGFREDAELRGLELARGLSLIGATAVLENLFVVQEALTSRAGRDPDILSVMIVNRDRRVIASDNPLQVGEILAVAAQQAEAGGAEFVWEQKDVRGREKLVVFEPLRSDGKLLGWVRVELSLERAWREAYRTLWKQLLTTVGLLVVALYVFLKMVRRLKDALHTSEEKYRQLWETSTDAVVFMDTERRIQFANPAIQDVFGYAPEEVIGRDIAILQPERLREGHRVGLERYLRTGVKTLNWRATEVVGLRKDGTEVPVEIAFNDMQVEGKRWFVGFMRDITERKRAEKALRRAEEKYRGIFENAVEGIFQTSPDGRFLAANPALARIYGYKSPEELMAAVSDIARQVYVQPGQRAEFVRLLAEQKTVTGFEAQVYRKNGSIIWISESVRAIYDAHGGLLGYEGSVEDITERKRAEEALRQTEEQLRQSQKMEAIGKLAGGIAHDFNNLLTAITGYSELLLGQVQPDSQARKNAEEIRKAAFRAASLTHQLLAFSRRQMLTTKVLNLNAVIMDLEPMFRRLIGEDIELKIVPGPALGQVRADPSQLEQIVLNLVVNARDAMPKGGTLTIETANGELSEAYADRHVSFKPGSYVLVAVSDTGCGMDAHTQARVFEPFFTTKEPGKGTGLGLATVYGIVKQSNGYIWVYSEPGHGSTFKVYLPRSGEADRVQPDAGRVQPPRGTETVLLVEDDDVVRGLVGNVLEGNGYQVLTASHSEEAFRLSGRYDGAIQLMVTDVVMPGMSGRELAERLASSRPKMKVLYISGYTDDAVVRHGVLTEGMAFLQKPFTPDVLLHKVREVLGGSAMTMPGTPSR